MQKHLNKKEIKYYGIHACLAVGRHRPGDIIRVYVHSSNLVAFRSVLKGCAEGKKAYHIVSNEELEKVSGSVHHEGVCILARESSPISDKNLPRQLFIADQPVCVLYLDGVQNPHNIGSILRTCAHFNVKYVIGAKGLLPLLSPAACRIAKGGSELVQLVEVDHPAMFIKNLKKQGFQLVTTSSHVTDSLYKVDLPKQIILAMGSEDQGVGKELQSLSSMQIQIPGSGLVESLNVSVAASLFLGEFYRQHLGGSKC
ncbi:MAG: tRNA/rRNA methyltransferase [Chlamydiae bacterium]|nr:tRNA/rRNA methyltransferase [Chlamydiota bacterium]